MTVPITLDDATFDEEVLKSTTPILVDFWAEWCGPCKTIAPILDEIASEQAGKLRVGKLNVDNAPRIAQRFGVMSIPTMILFNNGEPAKRVVGARPKASILRDLEEYL